MVTKSKKPRPTRRVASTKLRNLASRTAANVTGGKLPGKQAPPTVTL